MDKLEYEFKKKEIISKLGKPESDFDRQPLNESARQLKSLFSQYQSESKVKLSIERKQALDLKEQKDVVRKYRLDYAVSIELSEADLEVFNEVERAVLVDYFHNTNLSPLDLERPGFSRQKIVALMRSGPFAVLAAKVFDHLMAVEVRSAILKSIRSGNDKLAERFAEQLGILRNQTLDLNINKPIEDQELIKKLKELGDAV